MNTEEMQKDFLAKQNELRDRIETVDRFDPGSVKLVAGVDLAYWGQGDDEYAVCCIVVIESDTHNIVEKKQYSGKIEVPYMPGFLAFRELRLPAPAPHGYRNSRIFLPQQADYRYRKDLLPRR